VQPRSGRSREEGLTDARKVNTITIDYSIQVRVSSLLSGNSAGNVVRQAWDVGGKVSGRRGWCILSLIDNGSALWRRRGPAGDCLSLGKEMPRYRAQGRSGVTRPGQVCGLMVV